MSPGVCVTVELGPTRMLPRYPRIDQPFQSGDDNVSVCTVNSVSANHAWACGEARCPPCMSQRSSSARAGAADAQQPGPAKRRAMNLNLVQGATSRQSAALRIASEPPRAVIEHHQSIETETGLRPKKHRAAHGDGRQHGCRSGRRGSDRRKIEARRRPRPLKSRSRTSGALLGRARSFGGSPDCG
jgi:hypothetical protein